MTINLDQKGLKSIVDNYDLFFIDIWGVIHNGIEISRSSVEVLEILDRSKKKYVLLTNAPRPNSTVVSYLKKMGLDEKKTVNVYTSGEAALDFLKNLHKKQKFFHIGPPRDFDLFNNFKDQKTNKMEDSNFLLCTGLYDYEKNDLIHYKNILRDHVNKKMICTNPDLIVNRGNNKEYCAGSIAKIFEQIGGNVEYFGKPFPLVYQKASKDLKFRKAICIGDNLNTDIKGANLQNFDSMLILNGIHKYEIKKDLSEIKKKYNVKIDFVQSRLKW